MKRKKNYYFTFSNNHFDHTGKCLRNYWVRVREYDYWDARKLFIKSFSSIYLPAPDKWAYQYEQKDFEDIFFPDGEYMLITERKKQNEKQGKLLR